MQITYSGHAIGMISRKPLPRFENFLLSEQEPEYIYLIPVELKARALKMDARVWPEISPKAKGEELNEDHPENQMCGL